MALKTNPNLRKPGFPHTSWAPVSATRFVCGLALSFTLCLAAPAPAFYGMLETIDKTKRQGQISVRDENFALTDRQGETHVIPLSQLKQLTWLPSPAEPGPDSDSHTAGAPRAQPDNPGLLGTYYRGVNFDIPTRQQVDQTVDFNWETGAPGPDLPNDLFSVSWEGRILTETAGTYRFVVIADDGVRLLVNNQMLVDRWQDQSVQTMEGSIDLEAGRHYPIHLEYYERTGQAIVRLHWAPPAHEPGPIPAQNLWLPAIADSPVASPNMRETGGWTAQYFHNAELNGPFLAVTNRHIDFAWGHNHPLPGISPDHFSVRWQALLQVPATGIYSFHIESNDGMRFWIEDNKILEHWREGFIRTQARNVELEKDKIYLVRFEYFDRTGEAKVRLDWSGPSLSRRVLGPPHVQPVTAPAVDSSSQPQPVGALLTSGSFVAGRIQSANDRLVQFSPDTAESPLPLASAARLQFSPVAQDDLQRLDPGRTGLLLRGGDFIDGEFQGLERGRVALDSILLGRRTFPVQEVVMAVLDKVRTNDTFAFTVRTVDQSLYRAESLKLAPDRILISDGVLNDWPEPAGRILEIQRRP